MASLRRRSNRLALAFVAIIVALAVASVLVPDQLKVAGFTTPDSESRRSTTALQHALGYDPEPGMVVLARSKFPFSDPTARRALGSVREQIARDRGVGRVE